MSETDPLRVFPISGHMARCSICDWNGPFRATRNAALADEHEHRGTSQHRFHPERIGQPRDADYIAAYAKSSIAPNFKSFGELVSALREAAHLTQDDLGALMGLSKSSGRVTVAYWEGGHRTPKQEQLPKLAACLGYWPIDGSAELRQKIVERALAAALDE